MAKSSLPSVDDYNAPQAKAKDHPLPTPQQAEPEGYVPRNVDVRMTKAQARILRDKLRTLQDTGAKTADGKFVDNRAQAVRWIIENEVIV
jgi:hypothetical protein